MGMNEKRKWFPGIQGDRIFLREVCLADVNDRYLGWMSDPKVTKYTESRFSSNNMEKLKEDVRQKLDNRNIFFLAIIRKDTDRHIGNIKLGPIDWNHLLADVGVMIGDIDSWGQGCATEAIGLLACYAFQELNLHKLTAGYYAANKGSEKAFLNNGFRVEGVRKRHRICEGEYMDTVILGLLKEEWQNGKS